MVVGICDQPFILCCWTSRMQQSVNPAVRVGHYTRTVSTSTHNASVWSLTAAAPSDSVFRALCIKWLTCLLNIMTDPTIKPGFYLPRQTWSLQSASQHVKDLKTRTDRVLPDSCLRMQPTAGFDKLNQN